MSFNDMDYKPAGSSGRHVARMVRAQSGKRASSSTGKAKEKKGPNCKTNAQKKYWLTNPKAYKQKGYEANFQAIIKKAGTKA